MLNRCRVEAELGHGACLNALNSAPARLDLTRLARPCSEVRMSLRTRLFLIFGALLAALVLAQWWLTRTLTRDLRHEIGEVATQAASSTAAFFVAEQNCADPPCAESPIHTASNLDIRLVRLGADDPSLLWVDADDDSVSQLMRQLIARDAGKLSPELLQKLHRLEPDQRPTVLSYSFEFRHGGSQEIQRTEWVSRYPPHPESDRDHSFVALQGPGLRRSFAIPEAGLRSKMESFSHSLLLGSLAVLLVGLSLAAAVAYRVTRPLRQLSAAARQVGAGALGTQVTAVPGGEVGEALEAFNYMSRRVAQLDAEARRLTARQHLGEIGEIARGLAHSLRNPLNALGLSIEELAARDDGNPNPSESSEALAESARRQVRRIDGSIRSFLALASQGGGTAASLDLVALLRDVSLEALQDGRGRVRIEVPTELPAAELQGIEAELRAVIQALVVNAVEASPPAAKVEAWVDPEGTAGSFRLQVADRGPGLPAELRERLFTPHLTTKAHGSGMGLYLAQRIAQTRYGGHLELLDRDGGGTLAVLVLSSRVEEPNSAEASNG